MSTEATPTPEPAAPPPAPEPASDYGDDDAASYAEAIRIAEEAIRGTAEETEAAPEPAKAEPEPKAEEQTEAAEPEADPLLEAIRARKAQRSQPPPQQAQEQPQSVDQIMALARQQAEAAVRAEFERDPAAWYEARKLDPVPAFERFSKSAIDRRGMTAEDLAKQAMERAEALEKRLAEERQHAEERARYEATMRAEEEGKRAFIQRTGAADKYPHTSALPEELRIAFAYSIINETGESDHGKIADYLESALARAAKGAPAGSASGQTPGKAPPTAAPSKTITGDMAAQTAGSSPMSDEEWDRWVIAETQRELDAQRAG